MNILRNIFARFHAHTGGATALEYAMILALMVVAIIGGVTAFADANGTTYNTITDNVTVD